MRPTTRCPYCGAELRARTLELAGRRVFAGWEECGCAGARQARAAAEREEAERRRRDEERRQEQAIRRAGIMPRYERAEHPLAEGCADDMEHGRNLYLYGAVGTSKTYLASATARTLVLRGHRVRFTAMWKILDAIKRGFRDGGDPLPAYQAVDFLVLDDFGKESPTDFALERIFALVDERSSRMLTTCITTQYRPSALIRRLAKNGDEDTAFAIVSRLRQDCRTVELKGQDRRIAS